MSTRLTVVIPNWNGERFLLSCLGSLREQSFEDFESVLVDNGSTDGSIPFVRRNFPEVRVLPLGENRGFSAAVNAGIRTSRTRRSIPIGSRRWYEPRTRTRGQASARAS